MSKTQAEHKRDWAKNNPEKVLQSKARWRELNKEKSREMIRQWKLKNQDKVRAYTLNRLAKKQNAIGFYTPEDIKNLLILQDNLCNGCYKSIDSYHVDHIIPLSRGGDNWPSNLQILCPTCNMSKGKKTMNEWVEFKMKRMV